VVLVLLVLALLVLALLVLLLLPLPLPLPLLCIYTNAPRSRASAAKVEKGSHANSAGKHDPRP
jgi:hypothetical protein